MNQPPRASNQVSLWQPGVWQVSNQQCSFGEAMRMADAVFAVDKAIKRAKEQKQ